MTNSKPRVINSFTSRKVIDVNGHKYASHEKLQLVGTDQELVTVREVKLEESIHRIPIKGAVFNYAYKRINNTAKKAISMEVWEAAADVNGANFPVEI